MSVCSATYCKNFKFPFNLEGQNVDMVFSSVAGHLLELDFMNPYNTWRGCRPGYLYEAPVQKQVTKGEGVKSKETCNNWHEGLNGWCSGWIATEKAKI